MRKTLIIFLLTFFNLSFGQSSNFTLNLTAVNETCPGNGRLNFTVSNTTPGGVVIFTVYKLPDLTTPIVTTQANTFTGLVAANYRVVATESLPNGTSNIRQKDIVILDMIAQMQLDFQSENQTCVHLGSISVATISGYPVSYEIISGPLTFTPQTSNVFTGLVAGTYVVKVIDRCGEFITQNIVIENLNNVITFGQSALNPIDCNLLSQNVVITAQVGIYYPITVQYTVYEPSGNVTVSTQVINSGDPNSLLLTGTIPFIYGQTYSYQIAVTDSCGNTYNSGLTSVNALMEVSVGVGLVNCNSKKIQLNIKNGIAPFTVNFLSSPPGFNPNTYNSLHPNFSTSIIAYNNLSVPLPAGNYNVQVTDSCGRTDNESFIVDNVVLVPNIVVSQLNGCSEGFSSFSIGTNNALFDIVTAEMVSAPSTYPVTLPLNLNANIYLGSVFLSDLPSGAYNLRLTDNCGITHNVTVQANGYHTNFNNVNVIEDCSSFKIDLQNSSNIPAGLVTFWLQKFNPVTNQWVHPITGTSGGAGINSLNALNLTNFTISNSISSVGKFRVVKMFFSYKLPTSSDPSTTNYCIEEIKNFESNLEPRIKDIYSFSCSNNSYQVIVEAEGVGPLTYEIITKDGLPFYVNNLNSSVFNSLAAGVYSFKVTDSCGNSKSRLFEVSGNVILPIMATPFCNGSIGNLSVPYFSYLQYEWWKDNNTSIILSNSNSLTFSPFNFNTHSGVYHVRITNPGNPNTCINLVLDYTIQSSLGNPNAGNDSEITICGTHGIINLNSLLSANHDLNGIWSETSNSGIPLINGSWDSTNLSAGTYLFQYSVDGLCDIDDVAVIKINLKNQPQSPNAFFDSQVCIYGDLHLYASTVFGATYVWTGPNGFLSNEQNPVISNVTSLMQGVYTVKAILDGCESEPSSVQVEVNDLPDFQLKTWCDTNKQIKVDFTNQTVNPDLFEYEWVYPDGNVYYGNQNIEISSGETGNYTVSVTNFNGCKAVKSLLIDCTLCNIPKGVSANGDGDNDNFDLSCIDEIKNVKIYNRYGILIFEKDNYVNEWGGNDKKGHLLPTGTYYYLISFNDNNFKSGWVYLNY